MFLVELQTQRSRRVKPYDFLLLPSHKNIFVFISQSLLQTLAQEYFVFVQLLHIVTMTSRPQLEFLTSNMNKTSKLKSSVTMTCTGIGGPQWFRLPQHLGMVFIQASNLPHGIASFRQIGYGVIKTLVSWSQSECTDDSPAYPYMLLTLKCIRYELGIMVMPISRTYRC